MTSINPFQPSLAQTIEGKYGSSGGLSEEDCEAEWFHNSNDKKATSICQSIDNNHIIRCDNSLGAEEILHLFNIGNGATKKQGKNDIGCKFSGSSSGILRFKPKQVQFFNKHKNIQTGNVEKSHLIILVQEIMDICTNPQNS